jgi:hypothetical protein
MDAKNEAIVANWNFVENFPDLPTPLIDRKHLLRSMVEVVSGEVSVLFLEGEPGDGATCALAQFCREYSANTFSLFIKPASKLTYSLDYLRLVLAEQFSWCLFGEALNKDRLTESEYKALSIKVTRRFKGQPLYFVVDGLHQIPTEDRAVVAQVFTEILPTGAPRCRFLIAGAHSDFKAVVHPSVNSRYYLLPKFSLEECKVYLADTKIEATDCEKVYELCRAGSPGRLAIVRRLLQSGTDLADILEKEPEKYLEFVKLEFDCLKSLGEQELLVVANVAFTKVSFTLEDICSLSNFDVSALEKLLERCSFLRLANQRLEFISETHRHFACKQLETLKSKALEQQLDHLQRNPKSEGALRFLPTYLETLNRQGAIFDLLSKDHYGALLETTQSFSALKAQAELAAQSAWAMHKTQEVFKFSMHKSIFASAASAEGESDRVRALVALGKTNTALALANAEPTKEGRLALLCTYARRLAERNGHVEQELADHIAGLVKEVDFTSLGDEAMNIASDVLIFDPDSAIGIIEMAVKGAATATRDAAFTELSLSASIANLRHPRKIDDKARAKISDEGLQRVAQSFELVAGQMASTELQDILTKMPPAHQIHFLRSFVNIKRNDARILDLVELALDVIIREAEYTPRARDLAELCAPFVEPIDDKSRLKRIVARIQGQLGLVGRASLSKDVTLLQMRLAAGEYQYDKAAARDRIAETCYSLLEVKTPEVQMECLAVTLGVLGKIDVTGELEKGDGFRAFIKDELGRVLEKVLKDTADHIGTILPSLKVLAADDCEAALVLAARLNAEHRRDIAYQAIARKLVSQPFTAKRLESVRKALAAISNGDMRARATDGLLRGLDSSHGKNDWVGRLDDLRVGLMRGYQLAAWDCWMFKASKAAGVAFDIDLFVSRTNEALQRAASTLEEAKINFRAAEALAEVDKERAEQYYQEGIRVSQSSPFGSQSRARLFELCLSLVGRCLASLARVHALDDDKVSRHESLVDKMPGIVPKVRILNDFAERLWCAKREDLAKKVVGGRIRELLEQARRAHPSVGRAAVALALPSMCATQQQLALGLIAELPGLEADAALHESAMLRIRHLANQEPEANGRYDFTKLEVEDVFDVIDLISHVRMDSAIYQTMKLLIDAINDKSNRSKFTSTMKADWAARLRVIVDSKLPDPKNIQHNGYCIVCTALVNSLVDTPWAQWEALISQVETVPNAADRGYIFVILGTALPAKHASHRRRLLDRGQEEIRKIPSPLDRLSHLQGYAQDAFANDAGASARESLKEAMLLSIDIEDHARVVEHRRELIDLADQIDNGFANELIEMVDDDPARADLKAEAKQTLAISKAKRELADAKHLKDASACDLELLPAAAWKNLGALEAGRLEVKPLDVMAHYVSRAGSGTMHDAYPVLAWHITNLERKYIHLTDVRTHISPICEALLLSTELTEFILRRVAGKGADVREEESPEGLLVRRSSRADAVAFIGQWLRENAQDEVIYCDSYFSTKDIPLLRLCLAQAPHSVLKIIASKSELSKNGELGEEPFVKAWREQSDQAPPETEVVAAGYADHPGKSVVHDRWLVSGDAGLRLGTSFNSLGQGKLSEISVVDPGRVQDLRRQLSQYLARQRIVDAARMQYSTFTL